MTDSGFTRGEPYIEFAPRDPVVGGRVRVHLLLPDGLRRSVVVDDGPGLDDEVAAVAAALAGRQRFVKGKKVGG